MPNTGTGSPTPGTAPSSGKADAGWFGVSGLTVGYGGAPAVDGVSFAVGSGSVLTLLGPSGCGKSTLLRAVGGYLTPQSGRVRLNGRDLTDLPPERRRIGMVFQNYALFPHLTARRNVAFGLEVRGLPRAEVGRRTEAMLTRVGLTAAEWDRKPATLSGGQQQRVALARALVTEPDLLLLDEPMANLDRHLKAQMWEEFRRLQRETEVTTIMVTHDQEEALAVSDLLGVMADGRLIQVAAPADVYLRPRTPFVARFLGSANLIPGEAGEVRLVRPERCVLGPDAAGCRWWWTGAVAGVSFLGADSLVQVRCDGGPHLLVRTRNPVRVGDRVTVGVPAEDTWVIPEADG